MYVAKPNAVNNEFSMLNTPVGQTQRVLRRSECSEDGSFYNGKMRGWTIGSGHGDC